MSALAKAAAGAGCTVLALPLLAAVIAAALLSSTVPGSGGSSASPSKHALADIPADMLALYQRAAPECPGLSWTILAAIGKVETDHGRHPTMTSSAGAVGPMQFIPSTFKAYARPVPPGGKKPPTPWDPVDAVYAAARLLCANGAKNGKNLRRAIYAYCDIQWSTAVVSRACPITTIDLRLTRCPLVELTARWDGCRGPPSGRL